MNKDPVPISTSTGPSSRNTKDGGTAAGFLSKASSSLRRSPSRRHKSQASNPLPTVDKIFFEQSKAPATETSPPPIKKPDVYRLQTSSLESRPSQSSLKDGYSNWTPQSSVEASMGTNPYSTAVRKDSASSLGKSSGLGVATNELGVPSSADGKTPLTPALPAGGNQNPNALFQHIHEMSNKRIHTLDYFRKAHEGGVFWFNTLQFSRQDLSKLPSSSSTKVSRRAINYLLLGLSIPPLIEIHTHTNPTVAPSANATAANDFLRALNSLLGEFETYQQNHPPDGSTASSLSRARIPHMFKRATQATTGRARRSSSHTGPEIGAPIQLQQNPLPTGHLSDPHHQHMHHPSTSSAGLSSNLMNDHSLHTSSSATSLSISLPSQAAPSALPSSSFPSFPTPHPQQTDLPNSTLAPSETPYTYLVTPPLPFAPDFYTVFATLCDVLIDAYARILALVNSPAVCGFAGTGNQGLGEMFAKADARLRKVIVGGVVREFEGAAREGGKKEIAGVTRVVLGGLMGG